MTLPPDPVLELKELQEYFAFARERGLRFPLLADVRPPGEVARAYGAWLVAEAACARALFEDCESRTADSRRSRDGCFRNNQSHGDA